MGKRKQLVKELEAALEVVLEDYRTECTKRIAAEMELDVMEGIVNMFHRDVQRLKEERDAAEKDVAELLRNNETADSVIRDLRRELEGFKRECGAHSLSLLGRLAATERERDAALGNWQKAEDLLQERERELDTLQAQHAAASEALDLAREYSAKTIGDLRYEVAKLQAQAEPQECEITLDDIRGLKYIGDHLLDGAGRSIEKVSGGYKIWEDADTCYFMASPEDALRKYNCIAAPVICSRCGRDVLAKDDAAPAEPVVTLEEIMKLKHGERLIDNDGVIIECEYVRGNVGYWMYQNNAMVSGIPANTPQQALELYQKIKRGIKP